MACLDIDPGFRDVTTVPQLSTLHTHTQSRVHVPLTRADGYVHAYARSACGLAIVRTCGIIADSLWKKSPSLLHLFLLPLLLLLLLHIRRHSPGRRRERRDRANFSIIVAS